MLGRNIGVDLGTASVIIYAEGRGIVLSEPSVVAYNTICSGETPIQYGLSAR